MEVTFQDLNINKSVLMALEDMEFVNPTPVQAQAFSPVSSGKDIVGVAQTGTGKTLAYLLPLLKMWTYTKDMYPRFMVVVPTRELVVQVVEEAKKLSKYMTFHTVGVYGGTNINTQKLLLMDKVDLVVGTPGRLMDLALDGMLKMKHINKLVIDEVDEMLNLGFRTQLNMLFDLLPEKRQNIMFSATMTEDVEKIIDDNFFEPQKIIIAPSGTPLEQIILEGYFVPNYHTKINLLRHLLLQDATMTKVLAFAPSKRLADLAHELLVSDFGETIDVMHSNKSQNYRFNVLDGFESGRLRMIIATDIIARGLDIKGVSHVINLDTPELPEDFMHRVGRTGRVDQRGIAVTMTTPKEMEFKEGIEYLMAKEIPYFDFPADVVISDELIQEEKEVFFQKNYLPNVKLKSKGAFHEKLAKNKKVNLGGPGKKRAMALKAKGGKKGGRK